MNKYIAKALAVWSLPVLAACNATGEERTYDTTRPVPAMTPTQTAPADSTTGVARSSGRPGVAGDTISRSSEISSPKTKTP